MINSKAIRDKVNPEDIKIVYDIVKSTGFFRADEENIAKELIEDSVLHGDKSDYKFLFLEINNRTVAYSCFGLIPCSLISYDLYWIVVHNEHRGKGYGKFLMNETEKYIKGREAFQIYADTSSKEQYKPTRAFYEKCGYKLAAELKDFYDYGDAKVIYFKKL
jgi:ribosomal protein S18 acetylase RimI-like enzyme